MNIAVVGATGIVGETILRVMEERQTPVERLGLFASRAHRSAAQFHGAAYDVMATTGAALGDYDAVFFAGGEEASERHVSSLIENGRIVIDNSSLFRMIPGVPLIVPEVNAHALLPEHRLLPVGNCTAIILCVALAPVRRRAGLVKVRVATYQAVSGAGRASLSEFEAGQGPVVRNVIPQIGPIDSFGSSGEELKVCEETRKILELPVLRMAVTTVRVPVRCAHSEAVFVETERDTTVKELADAFESAAGIVYHEKGIVTPREVEGTDQVHVARLRAEDGSRRHFQLWIVGDQLRKGAATNGIQILELLISRRDARPAC